ncbi:hypothetical protein Mesil_3569 (plasmid) [Allomeiothermus silvanus DSM 9946]|uniref:Uncharacterized protein n=1 Tax=Allomeiothermus silvanus (strain ATCC 700542 / DSM 9946 / NBRC 106475 / NCIMB 13440 / VI-R2) TaxID=526227 RepID=D7BJK6_ALLS1|nr:hypothetical protein [Allomeiothermus silvanus]ADH65362.1 hypothetical protein Mesil_3569 [Allomeiothermus silvanus DSM 9946]
MKKATRNKYDLIRLGREVFPTRSQWSLEELQARGLPLYWNRDWLNEQIRATGSTYLVAQRWNYPWGEIKRMAEHFGIAGPTRRAWVGKYFLLDRELIRKIDEVRKEKESRNRWIVTALESYLKEKEQEKQVASQAKDASRPSVN